MEGLCRVYNYGYPANGRVKALREACLDRTYGCEKSGLEKVPVIIKKFDSRDETIEYEYKMQLNSRRLTDGEYFAAFLKLDEICRSNPNAQALLMKQLEDSLISLHVRFARCVRLQKKG